MIKVCYQPQAKENCPVRHQDEQVVFLGDLMNQRCLLISEERVRNPDIIQHVALDDKIFVQIVLQTRISPCLSIVDHQPIVLANKNNNK